jgi:cysteine synthase A
MPEDMSVERRRILRAYGAEIVITPAEEGMTGAVEEAQRILARTAKAFMPRQFENAANPEVHAMRKREIRRMDNSYSLFGGSSTVPIR